MLTRKQYELLVFINDYLKSKGVSPSFEEMKEALGLRSKSGIHRLITGLEERGFIRHLAHRARALEVLKLPENMDIPEPRPAKTEREFAPNVIRGDFKPVSPRPVQPAAEVVELPLYGLIAAGTPHRGPARQFQLHRRPGVPARRRRTLCAERRRRFHDRGRHP